MYKYFVIAVLVLLNTDIAYASNMGAMSYIFNIMFTSALLGIESLVVLVLYLFKMFKKSAKVRNVFNSITLILYVLSVVNLGAFGGDDLFYMILLLFGCGALAIILPNLKIKNQET